MRDVTEDIECNINSYASDLRKRADEDYISARMCYFNDLHENFLWDAQQSIEKYLKACALFHRINVKNQGHDLKSLYKKVHHALQFNSADSYWPQEGGLIFFGESFEKFLERLTDLGLNRYCSNSYHTYGDEIVKLDAAIFIIRRYCKPIGAILGKHGRPLQKQIKKCIDEGRDYTITGYLGEVLSKKNPQKKWLIKNNLFFPRVKKSGRITLKSKSVNHILSRRYQAAQAGAQEQKLIFIGLAESMLDNLYFPAEAKSEIEMMVRNLYKQLLASKNSP